MPDEPYIPVEEAADILQVTTRQAHRYGEGDQPRVRTRRAGRRVMFHKDDVEALAAELGVLDQPRPGRPRSDLISATVMFDYIRERDVKLDALQQQLQQAMHEIGRLQGALELNELQQRIAELEAERDALRAEVERLKQSS